MIMELAKLAKPLLPEEWNYSESVGKVTGFIYKWKHLTQEILNELWIAREMLSQPGRPWPEEINGTLVPVKTWTDYCNEIGSQRQTVNRWLRQAFDPTPEIIPEKFSPLNEITNKQFNKAYKVMRKTIRELKTQGWPDAPSHLVKDKLMELVFLLN